MNKDKILADQVKAIMEALYALPLHLTLAGAIHDIERILTEQLGECADCQNHKVERAWMMVVNERLHDITNGTEELLRKNMGIEPAPPETDNQIAKRMLNELYTKRKDPEEKAWIATIMDWLDKDGE